MNAPVPASSVTPEELQLILGLRAQNNSSHQSSPVAPTPPTPSSPFHADSYGHSSTPYVHDVPPLQTRFTNSFHRRVPSVSISGTPTRPSSQCSNFFSNSSTGAFSQQLSAHSSFGQDDLISTYTGSTSSSNNSQFTKVLQKLDESTKSMSMLKESVDSIASKLVDVEARIKELEAVNVGEQVGTRKHKRSRKSTKNLKIADVVNRTSEQRAAATGVIVSI